MGGNIFQSILMGIVVAVATWATLGAALAIAAGMAMAAASMVATSSLSQIGATGYGDVTSNASRSTSEATGIPVIYGGQLPHIYPEKNNGSFIYTGSINNWYNTPNGSSQYFFSEQVICMTGTEPYIEQIYFDQKPVLSGAITKDGIVDKGLILDEFRDYLQLEVRFGKPSGQSYSDTKSLARQYAGDKWNEKYLANGVVSIASVIKKNQKSLEKDILTNSNFTMNVLLKGMKIYDFTTGTIFATSCPVSQLYDYYTNEIYGLGYPPSVINIDSFIECASYCNVNNLYGNGAISYQSTYKENSETILQSFGGIVYTHAGQICLTVDRKTLSVATFNEDNMFGDLEVKTSGYSDYFNTIDAKYTSVANQFGESIVRLPADISADEVIRADGIVTPVSRNFTWIYDEDTVKKLATSELLKARYVLKTVTFVSNEAWDLKVWDSITVFNEELGINGKFKVMSKGISTTQQDLGYCQIVAVEYPDEIFDGDLSAVFNPPGTITGGRGDALSVMAPTNLRVTRLGTVSNGSSVLVEWDASEDPNLRGYYVYYKRSNVNEWTFAGDVNSNKNDFEIYGLSLDLTYDFSVVAYNMVNRISDRLQLINITPDFNFTLPSVTGLILSNATDVDNETTSLDFNLVWDSQRGLVVGNKTFNDYFKYYVISVYSDIGLYKKYYTQDNSFNFTFEMNLNRIRNPRFEVVAQGYSTGTYSQPAVINCINKQHPMPLDVVYQSGYQSIFINWSGVNLQPDYAGSYAVLQNTGSGAIITKDFNGLNFTSFDVPGGGEFKVKLAHYDKFGQDNMNYTPEQTIIINADYVFSEQDVDNIKDIIDLDKTVDDAMNNAIDIANSNADTKITAVKKELGDDIEASNTQLNTTIVDSNKALQQQIDLTNATVGDNTASISTLNQTVADNQSATSTQISQLKSQVDDDIASVNTKIDTSVDKLTDTVNSSYTVSLNANGVVTGYKLIADDGPEKTSAMYFTADKFVISPASNASVGNVPPFVVDTNKVYLNTAVIKNASIGTAMINDAAITSAKIGDAQITEAKVLNGAITNAKIGNVIQSNDYISGSNGWRITKDGASEFNNVVVRGEVQANSGSFTGAINATSGKFKGTLEATSFIGDIAVARGYADVSGKRNNTISRSMAYNNNSSYGMTLQLSCTLVMQSLGTSQIGQSYVITVTFNIGGQTVSRRVFMDGSSTPTGTIAQELRFTADVGSTTTVPCSISATGGDSSWDYEFSMQNITAMAFRTNTGNSWS
ncbi:phage tail tip fiber protein [Klebsiella variicola]|uniref:phage tail tip fiber protein n=1 Tax=Klebsiella variicola TaxID=244366 RepID=UPI002B053455|nr:fibronectin type III domain-containing protein [Klebsiella variicola]